jgi:hypothetical protein
MRRTFALNETAPPITKLKTLLLLLWQSRLIAALNATAPTDVYVPGTKVDANGYAALSLLLMAKVLKLHCSDAPVPNVRAPVVFAHPRRKAFASIDTAPSEMTLPETTKPAAMETAPITFQVTAHGPLIVSTSALKEVAPVISKINTLSVLP